MRSSPRQIRPAHLCWALLLAGVLAFLCVHGAAADTSPGFVDSPSQATLAAWASSKDVAIQASDCATSDSCIATGYFADSANRYSPLVLPITDGVAASGSEVSLPAGANTTGHQTSLPSVSCWDAGSCVAVGHYFNTSIHSQALVVPTAAGDPGSGTGVALPGNASVAPVSDLTSVSCADAGACVAAGSYVDAAGNTQALVVPISAGAAGGGIEVAEPSGAAPNGAQDAQLTSVACWSASDCVAVGSFADANGDNQALVVPITDGVPGTAVEVSPPTNAAVSGSSTVPDATLAKVSCWSAGSCVAVGSYATTSNNVEGLVVPIDGGVPGTAAAASLPSDAATANSTQNANLYDVGCTDDGQCAAVGNYLVSPIDQEPLVEPISAGVPGAAQDIAMPADAGVGSQDAALVGVSCPETGSCAAVGSYTDYYGDTQELTVPISEGVAGPGSAPPAFANEAFTYPITQLTSVSCSSSASCVALGTYANTSGVQVPTVFSMQAPITIGVAALPSARKGSSYLMPLSPAGAWGTYNWSRVSGSLPAGLSLNTQTGVISGTPTATGTSTFTVQLAGTGVPLQSTTQTFRVTIAPARLPHVSVAHGSLPVTAGRLQLELGCAGSPCRGTARFRATQVVSVKVTVKYTVHVRYKVRVKVKVKPKPAVTTTTPTGTTTTPARKPKPRYKIKWHTRRETKYRTELVHQNRSVVVGQANYSVATGASGALTVSLNRMGNRLLGAAKGHRLKTSLTVLTTGGNHVNRYPLTIMRKAVSSHKG